MMKKLLLTFSFAALILSAKSQIIITGYLANVKSTRSATDANNEYIQLRATEDIDFSVNNYAVVTTNNAGDSTPGGFPSQGWATGGLRSYKFNLISGTVSKGEFFYVGGANKVINGLGSTNISGAKWIASRDYSTVAGDDFGAVTVNLHANSGNPAGIAVFVGTTVDKNSTPIDVIFYGSSSSGSVYQTSPELGYKICDNDLYKVANGEYFRKGGNAFVFAHASPSDAGYSKLVGVYNTVTKKWDVSRTLTVITLGDNSQLADIENGAVTLPVSLTGFTAKANKQGAVNLAWATASEQNNSHFEITRSANGEKFEKIGEVKGNDNSDVVRNYSYTDVNPIIGANYYRLTQVDHDGKSSFSNIAVAKVGLDSDNLTVAVAADRTSVEVAYHTATEGKAHFAIYSVTGAKLTMVEKTVSVGNNQIIIPVNLSKSLHIIKVSQAGASMSAKF